MHFQLNDAVNQNFRYAVMQNMSYDCHVFK